MICMLIRFEAIAQGPAKSFCCPEKLKKPKSSLQDLAKVTEGNPLLTGDSSRDLFIPQLEVTNNHLKGHGSPPEKRSQRIARLKNLCNFSCKFCQKRNNQSVYKLWPDILSRHKASSLPVHKKKDNIIQNPFESLNSQEISLGTWMNMDNIDNTISLESKFPFQPISSHFPNVELIHQTFNTQVGKSPGPHLSSLVQMAHSRLGNVETSRALPENTGNSQWILCKFALKIRIDYVPT